MTEIMAVILKQLMPGRERTKELEGKIGSLEHKVDVLTSKIQRIESKMLSAGERLSR